MKLATRKKRVGKSLRPTILYGNLREIELVSGRLFHAYEKKIRRLNYN